MRFILFILLFLVACSKDSSQETYHFTESESKTLAILSDRSQLLDQKYYARFFEFYKLKLKEERPRVILEALENVVESENYNQSINEKFKETLIDFHKKHAADFDAYDWIFYNNYLGNYYFEYSEFDKANHYYNLVNSMTPKDRKSLRNITYSITDQAFCEAAAGHFFNALHLNYKAIPLFKELESETGYATALMNIGLINLNTNDYQKAKDYLNQATEIFFKIKDYRNYITCLHNTLILYENSEDPDFYEKIKFAYNEYYKYDLKDLTTEISIKTYYTRYLIEIKDYKAAEKILDDIKQKLKILDSEYSEIEYLIAQAELDMATSGKLSNKEEIIGKLERIEESEHYKKLFALYSTLAESEVRNKNWKEALYYETRLSVIKENFSNEVAQKLSQEMQGSYQKKLLEQKIQTKDAVISMKNIWIYGLMVFAFLTSFLFALFIFRRKQYNLRKDNIRNQKFTRQLIGEIEEERRRISADLHDSVNHDLLNIKRGLNQNHLLQAKQLENVINDIRNISRNIHPVLFEQIGFKASVKNLIHTVESSHTIPIVSEVNYQEYFDTFQELNLYRIIQECLSNAIKYSQAHAIQLVINDTPNSFEMTVKDNGKGFDVKKTLATKNVFGLESIYNRAKILDCQCTISSSDKGTTITIKKSK